jgi:capsid assembly protease
MRTIGVGPQPFPLLARQLLDRPLAVTPFAAQAALVALQHRLGIVSIDTIDSIGLEARQMLERNAMAVDAQRDRNSGRSFHTDGEIAVIPIDGTLVHKFGWLDPMCGFTGYDGITRKLRDAARDPAVEGIWLDLDSPGGSTMSLFALIEELASMTRSEGGKPIYAYVNEQACSAAYAIASVCDRVYGPASAVVGSIGCLIVHSEMTAALDEKGINVTIIRSGERKARGNPYEKLDKKTITKLQASVDDVRDRFAAVVAMGRGITVEQALATEADWFEGEAAVELGLMDAVISEREAWAMLEDEIDQIKRERRTAR